LGTISVETSKRRSLLAFSVKHNSWASTELSSYIISQAILHTSLRSSFFEKDGIQQERRSSDECLLFRAGRCGEVNVKCIRVRKHFYHETLGDLNNLADLFRVTTVGIGRIGIKNPKGNFAATLSTARIAFGAAIDAAAATARGWMQNVDCLILVVVHLEGRDTVIAVFFDATQFLSTRRDGGFLITAALAATGGALERSVDGQEFGVRVELLDRRYKGVNGLAKKAAATGSVFQRVSDLILADKVLHFGTSFAAHTLLKPASLGLANGHLLRACQVRLEGVCATVHLFLLHLLHLEGGRGDVS
jgi:hypothetical protein